MSSLMSAVVKSAPSLPPRIYFFAAEKWGKTSFGAFFDRPIFIMTQGETGLIELIDSHRIPETAHFPDDCQSWEILMSRVCAVRDEPHDHQTLVIDTANGAERLLSQHILDADFGGKMGGKEGYNSYGKGDVSCQPAWSQFLRVLDEVRIKRKMKIVLLAHAKIKSVNNPEGDDYDQFRPEGMDKLWPLTHKWSDIIAAGTYTVFVKDEKAKGAQTRVIRTAGSVAVVAGNRYGLPETIACGASPEATYKAFALALAKAKPAAGPDAKLVETMLGWLREIGADWSNAKHKGRLSELLGRMIPANAAVATLTADECLKLIAKCKELHAKKNGTPAAPPAPAPKPAPAQAAPPPAPTKPLEPEELAFDTHEIEPADIAAFSKAVEESGFGTEDNPPDGHGDGWEPPAEVPDAPTPAADPDPTPPQAPQPNPALAARASGATIQTILAAAKNVEMTWPTLRKEFAPICGFPADISTITDLSQEQAGRLMYAIQQRAADKAARSRKKPAAAGAV